MKFLKTLISSIAGIVLLHAVSTAAPTPEGSPRFSYDTNNLSLLFQVAEAKEPIYLILVEKNLQRLRVLEYDGELKVVADYPSATGENFGIKEISGDSKTPEGVYFITQIFRDDEITIFGDKAFHLDYPNFFDRAEGRNGDGIYIHGTNKTLEPNSTNGCVTLANSDLDDLEQYLTQIVTPVVIVPDMNSFSISTAGLTEKNFDLAKSLLLAEGIKPENIEYNYLYIVSSGSQTVAVSDFIYRPFNSSIMRGASRIYLNPAPGRSWQVGRRIWRASPLQIFPETPGKIVARPMVSDDLETSVQSPAQTAAMVAALATPPETSSIAADADGQVNAAPAPQPVEEKSSFSEAPDIQPLPTPTPQREAGGKIGQTERIASRVPATPRDEQQIYDFVEEWRQAWISQEIEPYIAFYDNDFSSGDKSLQEWREHKANLNRTYEYINVDISDIRVRWTAEGVAVTFRQEYKSDRYSATGRKTLILVHGDLGWKIRRELYSRI